VVSALGGITRQDVPALLQIVLHERAGRRDVIGKGLRVRASLGAKQATPCAKQEGN